jgi:hypothetical protein
MIPEYWKAFRSEHSLESKDVSVPEEGDLSGVGVDLVILDDAGSRQEAEELYPGMGVSKDGFVPVGHCDIGSGDPYFINMNDGPDGPLYRIYHEEVDADGYDRDEAVDIVFKSYTQILNYIDTEPEN